MNNEPVAWMETYKGEPNNLDWNKSNLNYGDEFYDVIPLYTHPAKTLTDAEIKELSEKHLDMDWQTGVIEFARAILRKAQEK